MKTAQFDAFKVWNPEGYSCQSDDVRLSIIK
jgi:hypothetical protein